MEQCIFCKIVQGKIPAYKIYEDESFLVFLDIRPISPGHALVISKSHHRWVWDVPAIGTYMEVVQKIVQAERKAFKTEAIFSKIIGEEVPHAHIWIYPDPQTAQGDKNDFETNAREIKKFL